MTRPQRLTSRRMSALLRGRSVWIVVGIVLVLVASTAMLWSTRDGTSRQATEDPAFVALGRTVYEQQCASCHGRNLEGQPNWRERLPNGRLPAPPHDDSGHTWHHPDDQLFGIVKNGMTPYAGKGYESDMPAFADRLSGREISAVLAFIESRWSERVRKLRAERLGGTGQP